MTQPLTPNGNELYRYQYAEVIDPGYPMLRNKALPIAQWHLKGNRIKAVTVRISERPPISMRFSWKQVILFRAKPEWALMYSQTHRQHIFNKLQRILTLNRRSCS